VTALITIRMGGSVVQACDARCYGARQEPCTCVCAGECHGVGLVEAIAIIRRRHPEWIAAAGEDAEAELDDIVFQEPLFTIGDHPMPDTSLPAFNDLIEDALKLARQASKLLAAGYAPGTEPGWQRDQAKSEATRGIREVVEALERARG
jgi:hypothetical protein